MNWSLGERHRERPARGSIVTYRSVKECGGRCMIAGEEGKQRGRERRRDQVAQTVSLCGFMHVTNAYKRRRCFREKEIPDARGMGV